MLFSFRETELPAIKGRFLCAVPHFGAIPGNHGPGRSRFIRDSNGPLSLCSLGSAKTGTLSNFLRRSCLAAGLDLFGVVSLDRGKSSLLFLVPVASGYLIGVIFFFVGLVCLFVCFKGRIAPLPDKSNPYLQSSPE